MARRDLAAVPANEQGRARLELEFDQPYLLGPLFYSVSTSGSTRARTSTPKLSNR